VDNAECKGKRMKKPKRTRILSARERLPGFKFQEAVNKAERAIIGSGRLSRGVTSSQDLKRLSKQEPKSKTKKAIAPWRRRRDAEGHALYGRGRIRKDYSGIGRLKGY